eukprot:GHVO01024047.1.p1 GENE.GHVO01024047.1~~GHVO01024047.1.p1  ORF type:complete len:534 (-),score=109.75 GHVO01024047.1:160-1761(-)
MENLSDLFDIDGRNEIAVNCRGAQNENSQNGSDQIKIDLNDQIKSEPIENDSTENEPAEGILTEMAPTEKALTTTTTEITPNDIAQTDDVADAQIPDVVAEAEILNVAAEAEIPDVAAEAEIPNAAANTEVAPSEAVPNISTPTKCVQTESEGAKRKSQKTDLQSRRGELPEVVPERKKRRKEKSVPVHATNSTPEDDEQSNETEIAKRKPTKRSSTKSSGKLSVWDMIKKNVRRPGVDPQLHKPAEETEDDTAPPEASSNAVMDLFSSSLNTDGINNDARDNQTPDEANDFFSQIFSSGGTENNTRNSSDLLRLDTSGNFIFDDDDMGYRRPQARENNDIEALFEGRQLVSENFSTASKVVPYKDAYKTTRATRWTDEDESKLYDAIEMFGSDLMLIRAFLPGYTDKQIKDKVKGEERRNNKKFCKALKKRRNISLEQYETIHGKIDPLTLYDPSQDERLAPAADLAIRKDRFSADEVDHSRPSQDTSRDDIFDTVTTAGENEVLTSLYDMGGDGYDNQPTQDEYQDIMSMF